MMSNVRDNFQAVILTGSRNRHNPLIEGTGLESKVLLPVFGKPMVLSVIETVAQSKYAPKMFVSTNDPEIQALSSTVPFDSLPSEETAVTSLLKSVDRTPGDGWLLLVSGDHPLLTPEMVDYFIDEVVERDLTMGVAVVSKSAVKAAYPQSKRTYFPAKGDAYSGGNMYLINKARFKGNIESFETVDQNRKQPWKSALKLLDPWSLFLAAFRQLSIYEVTERVSGRMGCHTGVVVMPYAECCMDVDKESDRVIAEKILAARQSKATVNNADNVDDASLRQQASVI